MARPGPATRWRFLWIVACGLASNAQARAGDWVGAFTLDGQATPFVLHAPNGDDTTATVDLPAMGARGVPLTRFARTRAGVEFQLDGPPGRFVFAGTQGAAGLRGTVAKGDTRGAFELVPTIPTTSVHARDYRGSYAIDDDRIIDIGPMDELGGQLVFLDSKTLRIGALTALDEARFAAGPSLGVPYPFAVRVVFDRDPTGIASGLRWEEGGRTRVARRIAAHRAEDVAIRHGDVELEGSLLLPAGPGPHPAVVLAHGSGAATRNAGPWNVFFLRQGMAVLSLDKRGAGTSGGDWQASSLDDIAGDWLAGVEFLKRRKDIDAGRIGVHGSSQGGWTAPLMAVKSRDIAFVIVRVGSGLNVRDTMAYEVGWSVREAGLDEASAREAESVSGQLFDLAAAKAPWPRIASTIAEHHDAPWATHAWPMQLSEDGWGRPWIALNHAYDATRVLPRTRVPVLWFLGDQDHNVPADASARALGTAMAGRPDFTLVRLPRTGHAFTLTDTGNNRGLAMQDRMVPGYWDAMAAWLARNGFAGEAHTGAMAR